MMAINWTAVGTALLLLVVAAACVIFLPMLGRLTVRLFFSFGFLVIGLVVAVGIALGFEDAGGFAGIWDWMVRSFTT